jgi:phage tail-like protein
MSNASYPLPAFHFRVTVLGAGAAMAAVTGADASFREISGIEARFDVEEVAEGGENRFVHRLPRPARYSDLVLSRGVVSRLSFFATWAGATIGSPLSLPIVPQNLMVSLLDGEGWPTVAWVFVNAWPLRWEISSMDSMANEVLTERMEFSYNYFERFNLGGSAAAVASLAQIAARYA